MKKSTVKTQGIVYTPKWIVDLILDEIGFDGSEGNIIDPACGDGAFLCAAAERIISNARGDSTETEKALAERIVGVDIDRIAVSCCIKNLTDIANRRGLCVNWNIQCGDVLADGKYFKQESFDFVVGNPPYIRIQNLGTVRRRKIQSVWNLCSTGSTDIYVGFMELGVSLLKEKGMLGFITPNTWLKTQTAKHLRMFLRERQLVKTLIDFGDSQLFEGVTTYSLISILENNTRHPPQYRLKLGDSKRNIKTIGDIPFPKKISVNDILDDNWILDHPDNTKKLDKLKSNGKPLKDIAKIHVGLCTLADKCYIFDNPTFKDKLATVNHPEKGVIVKIEKSVLKPIVKASLLKSPDDNQNLFILFPYKKIDNKHKIIPENELSKEYPLAYAYLQSVKHTLDQRDGGRKNDAGWYAFGRSQGLDTSFGNKILTSPMNKKPKFIVWDKPEYTFFSGYCVKYNGSLEWLANQLNSENMAFYIGMTSRVYKNKYKSYAKSFIQNFPIAESNIPKKL